MNLSMIEIAEVGKREKLDAAGVLEFIKNLEIETPDDFSTAVGMTAKVKRTHKERDEWRKEQVGPLNTEVKEVNAELNPGLAFLSEAEGILKKKIGDFVKSRHTKRAELMARVEEAVGAGDREKAEALIVAAEEFSPPKVEGCAIGEVWKGKVEDASKIPREYLMPDEKTLKALTKAKKSDPKIPGWKSWTEPTVTITESKVKV